MQTEYKNSHRFLIYICMKYIQSILLNAYACMILCVCKYINVYTHIVVFQIAIASCLDFIFDL